MSETVEMRALGRGQVWLHALVAAVSGAIFAPLVRVLGIAAVIAHGFYFLLAALAVVALGLLLGSYGRLFTRRRGGWWLAATLVVWLPAVVAISFVVLLATGSLDVIEPLVPGVGGLVAGVAALLAWRGLTRWLAVIVLIATAVGIAIAAVGGLGQA
jgi:hypothetical protein